MPVWINSTGSIVYGFSSVSVDGAVPAPLVGRTVGQPVWRDDLHVVYQDGGVGLGPWVTNELTYPGLTTATVSASGVNTLRGSGGIWAKWLGSVNQVITSDIDVGPFTGAQIGCVSTDPYVVVIDDRANQVGLTVYDDTGATIFTLPNATIGNRQNICLRDSILSYQDALGHWHLVDIVTSQTPSWYPRTDGVNWLVPVTFNSKLYVLERTEQLTLRPADKAQGWVLSPVPSTFDPDALVFGSLIRAASCLTIGCETDSLQVFDVEIGPVGVVTLTEGFIVGGAIVFDPPTQVSPTTFTVGPKEGFDLSPNLTPPLQDPPIDHTAGGRFVRPWAQFFQSLNSQGRQVGGIVQNTPITPVPVPPSGGGSGSGSGFTEIDAPGQPAILASAANTILTLTSTVPNAITLNPATNTVTFNGLGVSYVPMSTGAEPLEIMSDGAGKVLLVGFTP